MFDRLGHVEDAKDLNMNNDCIGIGVIHSMLKCICSYVNVFVIKVVNIKLMISKLLRATLACCVNNRTSKNEGDDEFDSFEGSNWSGC